MSAGVEPCRKNLTSPALLGTRIYGTFYDETLRRSAVMLNSDNYFAINIKKSETARRDICRGLVLAENPFRLLMIAVGCIADMSGDGTFLTSCQQSLENVYGAGLEDRQYIAHRISELKESIGKLERCLVTCNEDARERLQFSLRLQRNELEKLIKKAEKTA